MLEKRLDSSKKPSQLRLEETGDSHGGVGLPVAAATTDVLAASELLNDDLLGAELVDNRSPRRGHPRSAGCRWSVRKGCQR